MQATNKEFSMNPGIRNQLITMYNENPGQLLKTTFEKLNLDITDPKLVGRIRSELTILRNENKIPTSPFSIGALKASQTRALNKEKSDDNTDPFISNDDLVAIFKEHPEYSTGDVLKHLGLNGKSAGNPLYVRISARISWLRKKGLIPECTTNTGRKLNPAKQIAMDNFKKMVERKQETNTSINTKNVTDTDSQIIDLFKNNPDTSIGTVLKTLNIPFRNSGDKVYGNMTNKLRTMRKNGLIPQTTQGKKIQEWVEASKKRTKKVLKPSLIKVAAKASGDSKPLEVAQLNKTLVNSTGLQVVVQGISITGNLRSINYKNGILNVEFSDL